ncbi:MAG: restriction endonuclease subunit S, partial [Desulfobacterales bacterium]|nr:restriction endonuclease subunit S [Desulfobacterales bacterium]
MSEYNLPQGWDEVVLKKHVVKINLQVDKKIMQRDYLPNGEIPIIDQGKCLIGGYSNDNDKKIVCELPVIIFGDHTRNVKYISFSFCVGADGVKILKPNPEYNIKFFYYLLKLVSRKIDKGYARHYHHIEKMSVPLPPLPEQNRIVEKIEELFSELDKGVAELEKVKRQLEVYRQAVLKAAFEGRLANTDTKFEYKSLGEVLVSIQAGKSYRCIEVPPVDDEVGIVKVSSVTWGEFNEYESKTCPSTDCLNEQYLINEGDFLFSRANTIQLVGACVIVNNIKKKLMLSDKILRFEFYEYVDKKYILYFLRSHQGRAQIESLSTGNQESMRNIGQSRIRRIQIPFCE